MSTGFFQSSRGLRLGGLAFPLLFIMGMEVLSIFLKRAGAGSGERGAGGGGGGGGGVHSNCTFRGGLS